MIYEKVKGMCRERGISVRSIEIEAGLSNGTISKWDESMPAADNLIAVAKVLGTTAEALLEV